MRDPVGVKGIGIIGFGGFGEFCRRAWDAMDEVKVVAVCDSDPRRAPIDLKFYSQIGPLLADPAVKIVSIATPPNSHKDIALMAVEASKHVLVEKPLALSESDARMVKEAAARNRKVASVDFMLRFNRVVEILTRVVREEVFGKLRRIDLRNYAMLDQTPEGHWFWDPMVSGRILLEHGVHFFDLAHSFAGAKAADVIGVSVDRKPGIEDRMFATVRYQNGIVGTFWHSFSRPRALERTSMHLAFDLGEADMFGWIPLELKMWGWTNARGLDVLRETRPRMDIESDRMPVAKAESSEFQYEVEFDIRSHLVLEQPKMDVYSENLRSIMADLVSAIDDPSHPPRVTMDDGIEAVRVAEMATAFIHPEERRAPERLDVEALRP